MAGIYNYSNYDYFGHLCEVPQDVLNNLMDYYQGVKDLKSDLYSDVYDQWYAQDSPIDKKHVEISWIHWRDKEKLLPTLQFFQQYVGNICKFRFSRLDKDSEIPYHAKHSLPRIHIPLNDSGSVFIVKDINGNEHKYELSYGHAHFINVTMLHKVINTVPIIRLNSFFCFTHFTNEKLKERFIKYPKI